MGIVSQQAFRVSSLQQEDLSAVASVHCAAFAGSALSRLGEEAVRRYYDWLLIGPHDVVALGVFDGDRLLGFCFAGVFRGALTGFLAVNRGYLLRHLLFRPWLLSNPLIRERVHTALRLLRKRRHGQTGRAPADTHSREARAGSFGVLSIAVAPAHQGKRIGQLLMSHSEQIAREQGFSQMHLTVEPENHQAIGFYRRLGWVEENASDGRWQGRMVKALGSRWSAEA